MHHVSPKKSLAFEHAGLAALLSLVVAGCGGKAPVDLHEEPASGGTLCDGSERLVFRAFYAGGGQAFPGHGMQMENGSASFAVDGLCRYFISGGFQVDEPDSRSQGWREGLLDDDVARSLERSIGGADLSGLDACEPYQTVFDAPSIVISSAEVSVTCGNLPDGARAVMETIREHAPALRTRGQPLAGDLYVEVIEGANAGLALDWPSAIRLPEVIPVLGVSERQIISAADAAPVRALRERWLQGSAVRTYSETGIPVRSGERLVRVFLRDALPYENESGILPLPLPLGQSASQPPPLRECQDLVDEASTLTQRRVAIVPQCQIDADCQRYELSRSDICWSSCGTARWGSADYEAAERAVIASPPVANACNAFHEQGCEVSEPGCPLVPEVIGSRCVEQRCVAIEATE